MKDELIRTTKGSDLTMAARGPWARLSLPLTAKLGVLCASALALLAAQAAAAPLFSEDFEVDPTDSWTINHSPATDDATNFFFNYSSVGIPPAPNSNGTTRGMKLQANLNDGAFGGYSVSPLDLNLTGDYTLSFDVWSNYVGPLEFGGSGSTNLSTYGVLTSGTVSNSPGTADGVYFATTGDGGSSADWRVYSPDAVASYPSGDPVYTDPTRNHTGATYQVFGGVQAPVAQVAQFPQQEGTSRFGTAGMAWHEVRVRKSGDTVKWFMDDVLLATVDTTDMTLGGGNIMFGHSDINGGSSSDPDRADLLFTLVDNVEVVVPEPASLLLLGFGGLLLMLLRRRP